MCAVPSAPEAAGGRVWEVMSRGRGPRVGCPPPEGVDVAYPPGNEALLHCVADRGRPERSLARVPDGGDSGPDVRPKVGDALEHLVQLRLRVRLLEVVAEAQHE